MKKLFIYLCIITFSLSLFHCTSKQSEYSPEIQERINRVENSLSCWVQTQDSLKWNLVQRMEYYKIRGLSIAVVDNYKIEWAKGYGWADILEGRKVTTKTRFQAASISKSLNSAGILKLVQDGKLDLHANISNYLKSWKFQLDSAGKVEGFTMFGAVLAKKTE